MALPLTPHFEPVEIIAEIFFTLICVVACYAIFAKTRESYELTKHQGIWYFRHAFLFMGLSYALRLFLRFAFVTSFGATPFQHFFIFGPMLLVVSYLSTISIFYIFLSATSLWRHGDRTALLWSTHILAALAAAAAFITRSQFILAAAQTILLVACIVFILMSKPQMSNKTRFSRTKVLYLLIIFLWLLNVIVLDGRRFHFEGFEFIVQLIVVIVLAVLYSKISKWLR